MKKILSFILVAAIGAGNAAVPIFAQADEENREYILNHCYSDEAYDTTEEVFATGRYFVNGLDNGDPTNPVNDNVEFRVENGELISNVKTTGAVSHIEVDLRDDDKQSLTGAVWIEYKLNPKTEKKLLVQPQNDGAILTTTYYQGTGWSSVSTATGKNDPAAGSQVTDWGKNIPVSADGYVMKALYNTDTRTIDEFYCNGIDSTALINKYFRQNAAGINKLKISDNENTNFVPESDVYGIEYIKVWKEAEDNSLAQADVDALTEAVILNGQSASSVTESLNLPTTGDVNGSTLTWTANPEGVVDTATGEITPVTDATDVTLSVQAQNGTQTAAKEFTITVQPKETEPDYLINHDYSKFANIDEVFNTGIYYVGGYASGKDTSVTEDNNISFKLENGQLVGTVKSTEESRIDIDVKDGGAPLTGKVYIEYKLNPMGYKKTIFEPRGTGILTTTYFGDTASSGVYDNISTATGKGDPAAGAQPTDWGKAIPVSNSGYTIKALYNTDNRTIEEYYCNGADISDKINKYFRQNSTGIEMIRIYQNTGGTIGEDIYGLSYIKVWKDKAESEEEAAQRKANEDAAAITAALILNGQVPTGVKEALDLIKIGPTHGSDVTWTANPVGIVNTETGEVSDVAKETQVTLTATVTNNEKTAQNTITITVVPKAFVSKYIYEEDFEYATVGDMFKPGTLLTPSSSPYSMLTLSMKNSTEVNFKQTGPKASEAIFIDLSSYAGRLNGEHYVEIKVKKDAARANWQLKLYPETGNEFLVTDVSNTNLSWRLSTGWTGAPSVKVTDTNYLTVRMLLDFDSQMVKEVYVDDGDGVAVDGVQKNIIGSADGTVPFMTSAQSLGKIGIWANNNMVDGSSFDVDYIRIWDSEKSSVRADMEALVLADVTNENPAEITSNVNTPSKGKINGTEFKWTSSNPAAISETGVITRPQKGDVGVILTASAESEGEIFEKKFYLNVKGLTDGDAQNTEYNYDVYNNSFDQMSDEIKVSASAQAEIKDGKLSVKSLDASAAAVSVNVTSEDGSFGLTGKVLVEMNAAAKEGKSSYIIKSTDGSPMASAAIENGYYTITARDYTLTAPYRAEDNLKLKFIFDMANDLLKVYHNNMEIADSLKPITASKNIASLELTTLNSDVNKSEMTINDLRVAILDEDRTQMVDNAFSFEQIKGENASANEVRYDLNLFSSYILDSQVEWTVSDTSVINTETGAVTRPTTEDKEVKLTANIYFDGDKTKNITKEFTLKVIKFNADNLAMEKPAKVNVSAASGTSAANITDGLYDTAFMTNGGEKKFDVVIDLEKSSQISGLIIYEGESGGKNSIQEFEIMTSDDQKKWTTAYSGGTTIGSRKLVDFMPVTARYVKLAVLAKELGAPAVISEIEVVFDPTSQNRISADAADLVLDSAYTVTGNINLPLTGTYGSQIVWRSSHSNIISEAGKFTRPSVDTIVTLTASVEYGGAKKEKTFTKLAKGVSGSATERPSGGSSGGSSGGGIPYVPTATATAKPMPTPTATPIPGSAEEFSDLGSVPWAQEYIHELSAKRIVYGVGDGKFDPDRSITREEAVKMIVKAFEIEAESDMAVNFSDVDNNEWYSEFVRIAYAAGIVNGIDSETFGIGTKITREDFAVMIARALTYSRGVEISGDTENPRLADVSDYAKAAMAMMYDTGIMTGDELGNLNPRQETSRAQSAKIICMAMKLG